MSLLSRLAVQAAKAYGALSKGGVSASYLVVAGGGAGARHDSAGGGGGGAGGFRTGTSTLSILNTYSITVGAGGATAGNLSAGGNGSNSIISGTGLTTLTSTGGGGGGAQNSAGLSGGSGGGGTHIAGAGGAGNTPSTTPSQGNNGGVSDGPGGGGGGAGAVGSNSSNPNGGNGGNGTASSISGSSVTYAGGGGGGSNGATGGTGGTGGGGAGSSSGTAGVAGTTNRGGGGGGSGYLGISPYSAAGGSGIVIISYTSATPKFVGGTLTTSGGNQIHTFTSSGTLSPLTPVTASYLVVAGGGGGGYLFGGGGGAGGLLTSSTTIYSGATYVVTVGAGGAGATSIGANGVNGSNSVLSGTGITTITSTGGGGGAKRSTVGNSGGSGGGGAGDSSSIGGAGTSGQGFAGGTGSSVVGDAGGGGGGSSAVGSNHGGTVGGNGGAGTASSITGSSVTYAGGGGGAGGTANGSGGAGGGGNANQGAAGVAGTANTGGGGGASYNTYAGGAGGSGTVIISYAGSQVFNGGLVTSSGGNTIHTFNATGALTPVTNNLNNSLRFRASASAYLSRTFVSTGTNNKIQTFSAWVKRGLLSSSTDYRLMGGYDGSSANSMEINFNNDSLRLEFGGAANNPVITTQVFRDPSAWYHIVIAIDTTQATAANRVKMYVNGNQITAFSTATYPAQNALSQLTSANINNRIGSSWSGSNPFDGYMTDINFIDGQALEPYYFGNNDAYGNWKPIQYKGTYGTNGFYLNFSDTSAATAAAIGKDSSGNGNNWTPNNISVTAGTTYDAMLDVPTNTSATVANYAVLNPLKNGGTAPSSGNLNIVSLADNTMCLASIGMSSGKWYWEQVQTAGTIGSVAGIAQDNAGLSTYIGGNANSWGYHPSGLTYTNATSSSYGNTWTTNDIIGVAFDADNGKLYFSKNGTFQNSGNPVTGTNPAYSSLTTTPYFPAFQTNSATTSSINFGQRPFAYTAPSGYVALNTYNLPTPTILQGNKYMDATLYTGTSTYNYNIVNAGQFKPDLVWMKDRSNARNHVLSDSVRGTASQLESNTNAAQTTYSNSLTAFNSNGFTLADDTRINNASETYVGWQWQANQGSTVSNTSGSITSTVSVNTTAGFSILTYTGNATANATVGHGLGVTPAMIIIKAKTSAGLESWCVWQQKLSASNYFLRLDSTDAVFTGITNRLTAQSSTTFTLGSSVNEETNGSGYTYVAYCWAEIAGFSKFGSYTGNNSTNGPFVYLGFRPKFVIVKRTDSAENWSIIDSARVTYNVNNMGLFPALSNAESANLGLDLLSNGFKFRTDGTTNGNASGGTYIYMAFAENPFNNSNAK